MCDFQFYILRINPADFTETQENKRLNFKELGIDDNTIDSLLAKYERENIEKKRNQLLQNQSKKKAQY